MPVIKTFFAFAGFCWIWAWYVPFRLLRQPFVLSSSTMLIVVGAAVLCAGVLIAGSCALEFALRGRGTPVPIDPPRNLVTGALYRRVRNPMYLGFLLIILGEATLVQSQTIVALAGAYLLMAHALVVFYEEPTLRRTFGPDYDGFCAAVPRWIPRITPAIPHLSQ